MMLDKSISPSGGDIGERQRPGAGARGRRPGGGDPPQQIDELLGARAQVPADLDRGSVKRARIRDAHRCAVEPRAAAAPACEQFVAHGIVNDADLNLGRGDGGDRDAEMRNAAREIRRAVDRINDPRRPAIARRARLALFADEAVVWKNLQQPLSDERLRLAIDLGQIVLPALEADRERAVKEAPPRRGAGLARDRLGGEQPRVHERGSAFGHRIPVRSG